MRLEELMEGSAGDGGVVDAAYVTYMHVLLRTMNGLVLLMVWASTSDVWLKLVWLTAQSNTVSFACSLVWLFGEPVPHTHRYFDNLMETNRRKWKQTEQLEIQQVQEAAQDT